MLAALVAALLLAAALPLASAVDVTGRCVAGPTTGSCANLAAQVWENSTYTSANASATVDLFVRNQAFLPSACIAAGLPFLCAEAYKPCLLVNYTDAGGNNLTIGVPARPCRKLCVDTNTSCYSILASFNLLYLVQCDATDADGPQYPTSVTTYDVSAIDASTVDIECNNGTGNLISAGNVTCADELFVQLPPNATFTTPYNVTEILWESVPQYTGKCAVRCPNPQYGDDFWRSITIVWFVTCLVALLCSIATLVTFVLYPDRRKFPSILILHMTVACMIGAFSGTMSLWDRGDVKRMMCQHEWSFADWRRPSLCTAQALLFIFGQHGVLWWWLAIAFNMVALIIFRINLKQYYWAIVAFGWVPPFIFLFISIGLKDASPGISWPFCTPDSDGILYYPIGVLGSLGFLCSVAVVGWIIYITLRGNSDAKFWTLAQRVTRPVLFGLICAIPYAVVFAYRYSNKPAEQLTQVREYLLCIIQGQGQVDCGTVPRTDPAFNYALSISLSCIGILTFACYSTHVKYFTDLKAWTASRVTGLTTGLGSSSAASKRSSRREDDAWQRASSETEMQNVGAASRF